MGSDYLHVAIDDASRVAYVEAQPDQRAETAAAVLLRAAAFFAAHGVTIERVLTDRALVYTKSRPFRRAIADYRAFAHADAGADRRAVRYAYHCSDRSPDDHSGPLAARSGPWWLIAVAIG